MLAGRRVTDAEFRCSYLVAHDRLFDSCEVLKRRENNMSPLGTTDVFGEATKLLAQSDQYFVLILDRFWNANVRDAERGANRELQSWRRRG